MGNTDKLSSSQDAGTSNSLDFFFSLPGEEPGLHDNRLLGQITFSQNLEVSGTGDVDHGSLLGVLLIFHPRLLRYQGPQLVQIDGRLVLVGRVGVNMEIPHANLSEVAGMIFIEVDSVMMLATRVSSASGMLAVFAHAAMAMGDVTTELPGLLLVGTHISRYSTLLRADGKGS